MVNGAGDHGPQQAQSPALHCGRISNDTEPSLGSLLASCPGGLLLNTPRSEPSPWGTGEEPCARSVPDATGWLGQDGLTSGILYFVPSCVNKKCPTSREALKR